MGVLGISDEGVFPLAGWIGTALYVLGYMGYASGVVSRLSYTGICELVGFVVCVSLYTGGQYSLALKEVLMALIATLGVVRMVWRAHGGKPG